MATIVQPITKGAPFDAPTGGAYAQVLPSPHTVIYDTTAAAQSGNLYPSFATAVNVMNQFKGISYLYIQNGSIVPAGTWNMPDSWYLDIDANGTVFGAGVMFTTSPIIINVLHNAVISCDAAPGTSTFVLTNPTIEIVGANLVLGSMGNFIDATNSTGNLTLDSTVITSSGQTLIQY
jgi:hypothetical protein